MGTKGEHGAKWGTWMSVGDLQIGEGSTKRKLVEKGSVMANEQEKLIH